MDEPSVSVRNLTKSFGSRTVVNDLSFAVKKGEVFALLGHNGAGKSTTIDLILAARRFREWTPPKTENRYLSGLAYSFRIPDTSPTSPWKKHAWSMPLCMPTRQTIPSC